MVDQISTVTGGTQDSNPALASNDVGEAPTLSSLPNNPAIDSMNQDTVTPVVPAPVVPAIQSMQQDIDNSLLEKQQQVAEFDAAQPVDPMQLVDDQYNERIRTGQMYSEESIASGYAPEASAAALKLSDRLKMDQSVFNLDDATHQSTQLDAYERALEAERNYPDIAAALNDHGFHAANAARGDWKEFAQLYDTIRLNVDAGVATARSTTVLNAIAHREMRGVYTDEDQLTKTKLNQFNQQNAPQDNVGKLAHGVISNAPQQIRGAGAAGIAYGGVKLLTKGASSLAATNPITVGLVPAIEAGGDKAAKLAGKGAYIGLTLHSEIAQGWQATEGVADSAGKPLDKDIRTGAAVMYGIASTAVEYNLLSWGLQKAIGKEGMALLATKPAGAAAVKVWAKLLLSNPSTAAVLKRAGAGYLAMVAQEATEEGAQSLLIDTAKAGAVLTQDVVEGNDIDITPQQAWDGVSSSLARAGTDALWGGAVAAVSMMPVTGLQVGVSVMNVDSAKESAKKNSQLTKFISGSNAFKKSPELMRDFLNRNVEQKTVGLSPTVIGYFQGQGKDPYAELKKLGATDAQIVEATTAGTDILVDKNKLFMQSAAEAKATPTDAENPTTVDEGVWVHVRESEKGLTAYEAASISDKGSEAYQRAVEDLAPYTQAMVQNLKSAQTVRDEFMSMVGGMSNGNKMSHAVAAAHADIIENHYRTLGVLTGKDPFLLYRAEPLHIESTTVEKFNQGQAEDVQGQMRNRANPQQAQIARAAQQRGFKGTAETAPVFLQSYREGKSVEEANAAAAAAQVLASTAPATVAGGEATAAPAPAQATAFIDNGRVRVVSPDVQPRGYDVLPDDATAGVESPRADLGAAAGYVSDTPAKVIRAIKANNTINVKIATVDVYKAPSDTVDYKQPQTVIDAIAPALENEAQEVMAMLVANSEGKILALIQHRIGSGDSATAGWPAAMVGAALQVEGAQDVWMTHNHPSGLSERSQADARFNSHVADLIERTGKLNHRGHIIIGAGEATYWETMRPDGSRMTEYQESPTKYPLRDKSAPKPTHKINIVRRVLAKRNDTAVTITSPDAARMVARDINDNGVVMMDSQNRVVGFVPVDYAAMGALLENTDTVAEIVKAASVMNSNTAFVMSKEGFEGAANLTAMLNRFEFRVLDTLYRDPLTEGVDSNKFNSVAEKGRDIVSKDYMQWYRSGLADASANLPAKGTKEQMMAILSKTPGVKPAELEATGLPEYLQMQGKSVTKQQIIDYLAGNGVQVQETMLGDSVDASLPEGWTVQYETEAGEYVVRDEDGEEISSDTTREDAIRGAMDTDVVAESDSPKFGQYVLPGGKNYRELLLTLPAKEKSRRLEVINEGRIGRGWILGVKDVDTGEVLVKPSATPYEPDEFLDRYYSGHRAGLDKDANNFRSSHYGQSNILAHVRFNERTDADGKRVLFLEELQSDWAQAGRKQGFKNEAERNSIRSALEKFGVTVDDNTSFESLSKKGVPDDLAGRWYDTFIRGQGHMVPSAPFVTSTDAWVGLSMKRMIAYAAQNGFDRIAWTTGEQQADRYSLSKTVDEINIQRRVENATGEVDKVVHINVMTGSNVSVVIDKDGVITESLKNAGDLVGKNLAEVIGKDITREIVSSDVSRGEKSISGEGLNIGGEGMKTFYDSIVPNITKRVIGKMGGSLSTFTLQTPPTNAADDKLLADLGTVVEGTFTGKQIGFDITPEMKAASENGIVLFQPDAVKYIGNRTQDQKAQNYYGLPITAAEDAVTGQEVLIKTAHAASGGLKGNGIDTNHLREGALFTSTSSKILRSYLHDASNKIKELLASSPKVEVNNVDHARKILSEQGIEEVARHSPLISEIEIRMYEQSKSQKSALNATEKKALKTVSESGYQWEHVAKLVQYRQQVQGEMFATGQTGDSMANYEKQLAEIDAVFTDLFGGSWYNVRSPIITRLKALAAATDDDRVFTARTISNFLMDKHVKRGVDKSYSLEKNGKIVRMLDAYDPARRDQEIINVARAGGKSEKTIGERGVILPMYAHFKNPMVFDAQGSNWNALVYKVDITDLPQYPRLQFAGEVAESVRNNFERFAQRMGADTSGVNTGTLLDLQGDGLFVAKISTGRNTSAAGINSSPELRALLSSDATGVVVSIQQRLANDTFFGDHWSSLATFNTKATPDMDYLTASKIIGATVMSHIEEHGLSSTVTLNTRALTKIAADNGHDALIIKNVVDYGGNTHIANTTPETVISILPAAFDGLKLADSKFDDDIRENRILFQQGYNPDAIDEFNAMVAEAIADPSIEGRRTKVLRLHEMYSELHRDEALPDQYLTKLSAVLSDQVATVEGISALAAFMTQPVADQLNKATAKKMVDMFSPQIVNEVAAMALAGVVKRGWYTNTSLAIMDVFGLKNAPRFAALLSALSPQNSVQTNLNNSLRVMEAWLDMPVELRSDPAAVKKMLNSADPQDGKTVLAGGVSRAGWEKNAIIALTAERPIETMFEGEKIDNFQQTVMGNLAMAVIDTWSARTLGIFTEGVTPLQYKVGTMEMRAAAKLLTEVTGEEWTVAEVQETSWSFFKAVVELQTGKNKNKTLTQIVFDENLLDDSMMNEIPDIETEMQKIMKTRGGSIAALMAKMGDTDEHIERVKQRLSIEGRTYTGEANRSASATREGLRGFDYAGHLRAGLERAERATAQDRALSEGIRVIPAVTAVTDKDALTQEEMEKKLAEFIELLSYGDNDFIAPIKLQVSQGFFAGQPEKNIAGEMSGDPKWWRNGIYRTYEDTFKFAMQNDQHQAMVMVDQASMMVFDSETGVRHLISKESAYPALDILLRPEVTQEQAEELAKNISLELGIGNAVETNEKGERVIVAVIVPDADIYNNNDTEESRAEMRKKYASILEGIAASKTWKKNDKQKTDPKTLAITRWRHAQQNILQEWIDNNINDPRIFAARVSLFDVVTADKSNYHRYITDEKGRRLFDSKFDAGFNEHAADKIEKAFARAEAAASAGADATAQSVLYQPTLIAPEDPRGAININTAARTRTISLFEKSDRSTLAHELGHLFFDELGKMATAPDAPIELRQMLEQVLKHLGAKSYDTITVEQHEIFADGFLNYLKDSKSPSKALAAVFRSFKAWIVPLHKNGKFRSIEVSDEMRSVMDKLLATQDEIDAYRNSSDIYALLVEASKDLSSDEDEQRAMQAAYAEQVLDMEAEINKEVMESMRDEVASQWQEEAKQTRIQIVKDLKNDINWNTLVTLTKKGSADEPALRLNMEEIEERYGKDVLELVKKSGAAAVDTDIRYELIDLASAADLAGFKGNIDGLVAAVSRGTPRAVLEVELAQQMARKMATMSDPMSGVARSTVSKAIRNEPATKIVDMYVKMLRKRLKPTENVADVSPEMIRAFAEDTIRNTKLSVIRSAQYAAGEVRAAKMSAKLAAQGDIAQAIHYANLAMYEHYAFKAAARAEKQIAKLDASTKKMLDKKAIARLAKTKTGAYKQMLDIARRFHLVKRPIEAFSDLPSLPAWAEEMQKELGWVASFDDFAAFNSVTKKSDLTVAEYQMVVDNMKMVKTTANQVAHGVAMLQKKTIEELEQDLVLTAATHRPNDVPVSKNYNETEKEGKIRSFKTFRAQLLKMEVVFRELDGQHNLGVWWQTFIEPFRLAYNKEQLLLKESFKRMKATLQDRFTPEEMSQRSEKRWIEELGYNLSQDEILSIVLNMGNADNVARLMNSFPHLTPEELIAVVEREVTPADLEMANKIWFDLDDLFWSEIAAVEEKINGAPPVKVQATPFMLNGVEMLGGYYPIVYDAGKSYKAEVFDAKNAVSMLETNAYKPQTQRGHTKERVTAPKELVLKLGTDVLFNHIANVAHDVSHTLPVIDAYRMMSRPAVRDIITKKLGREVYSQMTPWLQAIANDTRVAQSEATKFLSGYMKNSVVLGIMGYKLTTAMVQPLGATVSLDFLLKNGNHGAKYMTIGARSLAHPKENFNYMVERSVMMRNRVDSSDREMRELMRESEINSPLYRYRKGAMFMTAGADMGVSMSTWYGAYNQAMMGDANDIAANDEVAAVQYADMAVRMSQGSGIAMDLSFIQREGGLTKLLTMFGSYWSVVYNVAVERGDQGFARLGFLGVMSSVGLLWLAPAVMETAMRDMFRSDDGDDDDSDDEKSLKRYGYNVATYPFQTIPVLNSVVRTALAKPFDQFEGDLQLTPVESMLKAVAKTPAAAYDIATEQGDAKRSSVKTLWDVANYALGTPSAQLWASGSYLYDLAQGNEEADSAARVIGGTAGLIPYDDRKTK